MDYLHHLSAGISVVGVLVIAYGVAIGLLRFVRPGLHTLRGTDSLAPYLNSVISA